MVCIPRALPELRPVSSPALSFKQKALSLYSLVNSVSVMQGGLHSPPVCADRFSSFIGFFDPTKESQAWSGLNGQRIPAEEPFTAVTDTILANIKMDHLDDQRLECRRVMTFPTSTYVIPSHEQNIPIKTPKL